MRVTFVNIGLIALALAGCSRPRDEDQPSAPDVPVTAAPGVAFAYRYAFALPTDRLSVVQEAHARACEALGVARCRVTGFRYRVDGADSASGQLAMRLAPAIARRFGRQGVEAVQAADGRLIDAQATGTDAGAEIERLAAEGSTAATDARTADIRAASLREGYRRDDRLTQRDEARARQATAGAAVAEQRRALATTPVTFEYASGPGLPLFDTDSPLRSAAAAGLASARATLAIGLGAAAILVPPMLLLLLLPLPLLWRRLRPAWRRWFASRPDATPA